MAKATLRVWHYTILFALTLNTLMYMKFARDSGSPKQTTFVQLKIETAGNQLNPKQLESNTGNGKHPKKRLQLKPINVKQLGDGDNDSVRNDECLAILNRTIKRKGKTFKMLWYDPLHGGLYPEAQGVKLSKCEYNNCVMELFNTSKAGFRPSANWLKADAILFDGSKLATLHPPKRRDQDQAYVFVDFEPPAMHHTDVYKTAAWQKVFNWTMTHRMDSDILYTYGKLTRKTREAQPKDYSTLFRRKDKQALWLVSSCQSASQRNMFVKKLQKYINVEIFGACSPKNKMICKAKNMTGCLDDFARYTYKFYLSMENSFCKDYLSEKVYRWYDKDVIPVVRGTTSKKALLPPGTYVDTDDFPTIKDLGLYIQKVGRNETLFVSYLKEKDKYNLKLRQDMAQSGYCEICKRLNHIDCFRKSYGSIATWWSKGACRVPTDLH